MTQFDLLSAVQPASGWFAVLGIKGAENIQQHLVETREEVDAIATRLVNNQWNVFFGVAKYKDDSGRKKSNVLSLKSFWLDIDCGPTKTIVNAKTKKPGGYATQQDGLKALQGFCQKIGLPKPIIVNSGRGLHVYWPTVEELTPEEWQPIADRLRELCVTHDLYVDPVVFETARILRIPGTFNYKDDPALEVKIEVWGKPTPVADLRSILGVREKLVQGLFGAKPARRPSMLGEVFRESIEKSFSRIMKRSVAGAGCQQLLDCYANRAVLSEARWFDALSVAKFCKDKDKAIHKLSEGHPEYDPAKTEQKIAHIQGPHNCATFERNNPGGCAKCPHLGKIKNPIMLGVEVVEADKHDGNYKISERDEANDSVVHYLVPEYPAPYVRGRSGGVWRQPKDPEDEPLLVYEDDLYLVKRMQDPQVGGVVLIRHHTPKDGVKEFTVANSIITDAGELRKVLAAQDVLCAPKQFPLVAEYLLAAMKVMRKERKSEQMRLQFGWADNDSKFIVGDREVGADGTYYSPPSTATKALSEYMVRSGTFEKWKEVFDLYGRPGLEGHAFAAATAFGAPLLKLSGHKGAIINVLHQHSGTGKTTILHMCNSVWGSPDGLCAKKDDTFASKVFKLGVFNNLPICFDEMSNTEPKQLSELSYLISQGSGKDRMKSSSNELRINSTSWQTIALCSSNHSFYDKLEYLKQTPEGEMMRIIEFNIDYSDAIDTELGKQMFDHQLLENYGHAGEIYARYLVTNYEEVKKLYAGVQSRIDTILKLTQRERFWSAAAAANITGIYIAARLGLLNWDQSAIFKWACEMILGLRKTLTPPPEGEQQVLGEYLLGRLDNVLVINDQLDRRSKMEAAPTKEPKYELMVRYEPDTKLMYVTVSSFRTFCTSRNIAYRATLNKMKEKGLLLRSENKRMAKGTQINTPGVQALVFDAAHPDFANMSLFAAEEAKVETVEETPEAV